MGQVASACPGAASAFTLYIRWWWWVVVTAFLLFVLSLPEIVDPLFCLVHLMSPLGFRAMVMARGDLVSLSDGILTA